MDLAINGAFVVDFESVTFKKLSVGIKEGIIAQISKSPIKAERTIDAKGMYLSTGLIDCHCHIESTHLTPYFFAKAVKKHGTLHVVADCHEIANVFGRRGLEYFMEDAQSAEINIKFAIPSCVPATEFATSGGRIEIEDVEELIKKEDVVSLGELMNVPAVVKGDKKFLRMIDIAKSHGKRVNGHAPHLDIETLKAYREAGVEDDHESYDYDELKEKLKMGFFVFIREGSAEHSTDAAYRIIEEYPDRVAFCSDDKSINDILSKGHINYNIKKAIRNGIDPALALKVASYNGLKYYGLEEFAAIEEGKKAMLVLFDDNFNALQTITVARTKTEPSKPNREFLKSIIVKKPLLIPEIEKKDIAIGVKDGSLITEKIELKNNQNEPNPEEDILKLVVIERYGLGNRSACFVKGFGLKKGAIATSLAHDCHNIVAVGTSDESIKRATEIIIEKQGGQVAVEDDRIIGFLHLPIAGIVSNRDGEEVAKDVENLKAAAKKLGCTLTDPFGMLSFMALEVIPHIKLTDRGLFDIDSFGYIK